MMVESVFLSDLLSEYLPTDQLALLPVVKVQGLSLDSRKVQAGDLFFAIDGNNTHGGHYIKAAIDAGAIAVCYDSALSINISQYAHQSVLIKIDNLALQISEIAAQFYQQPSSRLNVVAVTGTDGKTSSSHFIAQLFEHAAVIGTLGNGVLSSLQAATHTTPEPIELQRLLNHYVQRSLTLVAMEASSHGLDQQRLAAVKVRTAVLTNFARDHLDYHRNIDDYKAAKATLFAFPSLQSLVLNLDDRFGQELCQQYHNIIPVYGYGLSANTGLSCKHYIYANINSRNSQGFNLTIYHGEDSCQLTLPLLGDFNIYNALAALSVKLSYGFAFQQSCRQLKNLQAIAGRMELITAQSNASAVVDYAHTPQALMAALQALRKHFAGNIICVFGCGGDRDKGKRALMAQSAANTANYVIVTDDNPRTEDPEAIAKDIVQGFNEVTKFHIEHNRHAAIVQAFEMANTNDVVLIAGKGHENYQWIGEHKVPFSDQQVVREHIGLVA